MRWGGLFLATFLAIHWQEVSSPTFNVDDWALITDPILQAQQSRPGWDLIYGLLFQHSFSPFFNWLIAAASLYILALLPCFFFDWLTLPWCYLSAVLISSHAYLLDLFNFSFAIGLYLLPAALSVLAALLMGYGPRPLLWNPWLDGLAGVALVMVAMAIYQPTGYVGMGLIALDLLARALDRRRFRPLAWLRVASGSLMGCLLYYGWSRAAMVGTVANARTGFASFSEMVAKILDGNIYREIYNTHVPLLSTAHQFLFGCVFLLLLLIASIQLLWPSQTMPQAVLQALPQPVPQRWRRLAQLWLAAALLTLLPLLLFYVLRAGFPSRAFCLTNLGIAWFMVVLLARWQGSGSSRSQGSISPSHRFLSRFLVAVLIVAYIVPQAAFASKVWDRQQLLERRDMAMAQSIASDVRSTARLRTKGSENFRVFGTTERNESFPHWSSVGESVFRQSWSIEAIFHQLLGLKVEHIAYRQQGNEAQIRALVPACQAYPDPAAIVWYKGQWLVCLEANPAGGASPQGAWR
jgi:hypothetical protein